MSKGYNRIEWISRKMMLKLAFSSSFIFPSDNKYMINVDGAVALKKRTDVVLLSEIIMVKYWYFRKESMHY